MPKRRAASRWLSPSTWQAWRTRAYSSTAFILTLPAVRTGRKIRRRLFTPPPRPDTPAASVRDFLSAAYIVGLFPNEEGLARLIGALMLEQSDEWAVSRRYFSLESLARLADTHSPQLPAVAAGAGSDPS